MKTSNLFLYVYWSFVPLGSYTEVQALQRIFYGLELGAQRRLAPKVRLPLYK